MLSGQGLREGLARNPHDLSMERGITLPPTSMVRLNTLSDLSQRFAPRYSRRGPRRSDLAAQNCRGGRGAGRLRSFASSLQCAAFLLDVGSAIDFYNRLNRTSSLVVASDLPGFSHRESAQITAILLAAERGRLPRKYRRSTLLSQDDRERIGQAAVILLAADELERRAAPRSPRGRRRDFLHRRRPVCFPLRPGPRRLAASSVTAGSRNLDSLSSSSG